MEVIDFLEAPLQSVSLSGGWFTEIRLIIYMYVGGENMKKSIQKLICIHMVIDGTCEKCQSEGNSFRGCMCDAHSHGMDKFRILCK